MNIIIVNDDYALWRLYVPIIMIILLTVMIYFHRHHALRYLYIINIFCYLAAIFSYFIFINHLAEKDVSTQLINAVPFIWLIGIFAGYFLSVVSVSAFVIEHAQRHTWANVILGIAVFTFIVLCIIGVYFFVRGILSLKSG